MEVGSPRQSSLIAAASSSPDGLIPEVNQESAQVSNLDLADMRMIGEAQQQWAPLRRKYNLFLYRKAPSQEFRPEHRDPPPSQPLSNSQAMDLTPYDGKRDFNQFSYVDEPFLSWDFSLLSTYSKLIGSVNRNFSGLGREIFTDTGGYVLRMEAASLSQEPRRMISQTGREGQSIVPSLGTGMTLDQRAVMLATAVSVDFDYFSRHSGSGATGLWPMWFPGWGGGTATGEAGAEADAGGEAVEGARGSMVKEGETRGMGQDAAVGAGTLAGYDLMQKEREDRRQEVSPNAPNPVPDASGIASDQKPQPNKGDKEEDVW